MIRDILYFDFDKAASVWSQLDGSVADSPAGGGQERADRNRRIRSGIERPAADARLVDAEERSFIGSALLHRDLLDAIETDLSELGFTADLNAIVDADETSGAAIREAIGESSYVKAEGWSAFEDFQRILTIADHFNEIIDFIGKAEIQSVRNTEGYQELQRALDDARTAINASADRNQKAIAKTKLQNAERQIAELLRPGIMPIEAWLLDGVQKWISTFMTNRINLRVYPFTECPSFQVIGNLKLECFIDLDLKHILYGYGHRPNVPLTVFGLVTSIPPEGPHPFDPMREFEILREASDKIIFEKIFRSLFNVMGEIESFVKFSRYPNVMVHPIAVFRQLRPRNA